MRSRSINQLTPDLAHVKALILHFYSFTVGKINVEKSNTDWLKIESKYTMVSNGSHHPENCSARHKVAILVPFRDRESHLRIFLNHMHAFLMKQQLEYAIYVVELVGLIHDVYEL